MAVVRSRRDWSLRSTALIGGLMLLLPLLVPDGTAWGQAAEDPDPVCPEDGDPAPFTDRGEIAAVHLANVDCVSALEIVTGFVDGTYRPAGDVRRDQLATFLFRTLQHAGADLPAADPDRFPDVPVGSAHDEAIHRLKAAGVTRGAAGGEEFSPATRIRRDQLVSFLARGVELAAPGTLELDQQRATRFDDVPATSVHSGNVEQTAELGIVAGFDAETFGPAAATRRDQLATFMIRLLEVLRAHEEPEPVPTLTLVRDQPFAVHGNAVNATATLELDGEPVEGVDVNFAIDGEGATPTSTIAVTDAQGEATLVFTSSETEVVTVTATATAGGQNLSAQVQVSFGTGTGGDVFTLTVDPGPVPEESVVTATATLTTEGGAPISGRAVTFTTSGAPTHHLSADSQTVDGEAQLEFLVTGAGTVTVRAQAILNPHHDLAIRSATVQVQ
ncbi:MAG: Ig-like domain-containing protein [Egibacteraceae bacterium]